jgi:hypothetical protein
MPYLHTLLNPFFSRLSISSPPASATSGIHFAVTSKQIPLSLLPSPPTQISLILYSSSSLRCRMRPRYLPRMRSFSKISPSGRRSEFESYMIRRLPRRPLIHQRAAAHTCNGDFLNSSVLPTQVSVHVTKKLRRQIEPIAPSRGFLVQLVNAFVLGIARGVSIVSFRCRMSTQ